MIQQQINRDEAVLHEIDHRVTLVFDECVMLQRALWVSMLLNALLLWAVFSPPGRLVVCEWDG